MGAIPSAICQSESPHYVRAAGTGGVGRFVPGHWGVITAAIDNPSSQSAEVIAATYFESDPHRQYGRLVWLPPGARRITYYPLLAPRELSVGTSTAAVKSLLIDRRSGRETLIPTHTGEMLHAGMVSVYHETIRTAMIVDSDDDDVRDLVQAMRATRDLTVEAIGLFEEPMPNSRELLAAVDQLVISSDRLLDDALALQAVRQWLYDGGRLWLLLDHVSLDLVNALVGEHARFELIDKVDLNQLQIADARLSSPQHGPEREFDKPVVMARVVANDVDVVSLVNGWPAAMWLDAGRGRVLLTTVAPRGWYRDPVPDDVQSPESARRSRYVATTPLRVLGAQLLNDGPRLPLPAQQLESPATSRIGYQVVPRSTVAAVLGAFCLSLAVAGALLARLGKLELFGIVGPLVALLTAGILTVLGAASRSAVPPTVVTSQFVEVSPDVPDVRVRGVVAAYAQTASPEPLAARHGGYFHFEADEQAGRERRMLWTDVDRWHWQNVDLPHGVHVAPFTYATTSEGAPIAATMAFGENGISGRLELGRFNHPTDALIVTSAGKRRKKASHSNDENGRRMAVRLATDGAFSSGIGDVLARGEYFRDAVLDDGQRRRRLVLEQLLQSSASHYPLAPTLLVWCEPLDLGFCINDKAEQRGEALVAIPLVMERTEPNAKVVIPASFLPYESVPRPGMLSMSASYDNTEQAWVAPLTQGSRTLLRFALPESVLPLSVDLATIEIDIKAPGRVMTLRSYARGDTEIELTRESSPVGTYRYRIDRADALQLDVRGGLLLEVDVGEIADQSSEGVAEVGWQIDDIRLEIRGVTRKRNPSPELQP